MKNISNLKPVPGIFMLKCVNNGKMFIGQSVNVRKRVFEHKRDLEKRRHNNQDMQYCFSFFGDNSFEAFLLEEVKDKQQLKNRCAFWSDKYNVFDEDKGFNLCPNKVGQAKNNEFSKKVRGNKNGNLKLEKEDIIKICKLINKKNKEKKLTFKKIGEMFNVSPNAISSIGNGRTRGNISKEYLDAEIINNWSDKNKEKWSM